MQNFANVYYGICLWIMRFVYVNLLWILFSIAGLIAGGAMPATAAMFAVIRKWVMGEGDIPIFHTFWNSYRTEFFKANLLGYILLAIGYVMYLDLQFLRSQESLFYQFLSYGILGLFFVYFIVLLYVFPLFVHFETKIFQYIKWALVIGITHPLLTILMAAGIVIAYYIIFMIVPALIVFFSGSVLAYVLMWGASRTFTKFESRENGSG